jgi:hypothetical protein
MGSPPVIDLQVVHYMFCANHTNSGIQPARADMIKEEIANFNLVERLATHYQRSQAAAVARP